MTRPRFENAGWLEQVEQESAAASRSIETQCRIGIAIVIILALIVIAGLLVIGRAL